MKSNKKAHKASAALSKLTSMIGVTYKKGDIYVPWEIRSLNEAKIVKV